MLKKCVLLCILCLPSSLNSMLRINWPLLGRIADFGVLNNPTQEDSDAYVLFMNGTRPITLVADNFNRENELKAISQILAAESNRFEERCERIMIHEENSSSIEETLLNSNRVLFARILDAAVVCNARGNSCKPDYDAFRTIMAQVVAKISYEPVKRMNEQLAKSKAELRETKTNLERNRADSLNLKREFDKLNKDLTLAIKDNIYNLGLIGQAISAMNDLESTRDGLHERAMRQERLLQTAEAEIKKREQELLEEQERYAKETLEKAKLFERFEQEIKQIASQATQRHEHSSSAIAQLRKQISPLRRELSPLRRQVKAQELALSEKDSEIARLKQLLQNN